MTAFGFRVYGTPVPQGSMKAYMVGGHARLTSDNVKLKPWREAVKTAAREVMSCQFDTPVAIKVKFFVPRPKSAPKRVQFPGKKPDLDKLVRGVFDALTEASVWIDDSLAVDIHAKKRFAYEEEPMGCIVHIEELS